MIEPKELRIGNYLFDDDGCIIKVVGFSPYEHSIRCDEAEGCMIINDIYSSDGNVRKGYECESKDCNPIELTSEWLEKFGFKKKEESAFENIKMKYWVHEAVCMFFNEGPQETSFLAGYGFNTFEGKYYGATIRWINHVHTLQNIFYHLTNKELTIKSINQSN